MIGIEQLRWMSAQPRVAQPHRLAQNETSALRFQDRIRSDRGARSLCPDIGGRGMDGASRPGRRVLFKRVWIGDPLHVSVDFRLGSGLSCRGSVRRANHIFLAQCSRRQRQTSEDRVVGIVRRLD